MGGDGADSRALHTPLRHPGSARIGGRTPRRPAGRRRSGHPRARETEEGRRENGRRRSRRPRRGRVAGPANPRGRVRRDDAPATGGKAGRRLGGGGDGGSRMGYRGERRASRDTLGSRFPLDRDRTASPRHATHDATERPTPEAPPHHPAVRCLRSRRSPLSLVHTHTGGGGGGGNGDGRGRPADPSRDTSRRPTASPKEPTGPAGGRERSGGKKPREPAGRTDSRGARGKRRRPPPPPRRPHTSDLRETEGPRGALRADPQPRDPQRRNRGGAIDRQATLRQA